jgi:high-affinity Fe2+/Pb2+ permease
MNKLVSTLQSQKEIMSKNKKSSSDKITKLAAETLNDQNSSDIAKSLAGSVLSQSGTDKETSGEMEDKASKVLQSEKYSENTKSLAASVLSQSNKDR